MTFAEAVKAIRDSGYHGAALEALEEQLAKSTREEMELATAKANAEPMRRPAKRAEPEPEPEHVPSHDPAPTKSLLNNPFKKR